MKVRRRPKIRDRRPDSRWIHCRFDEQEDRWILILPDGSEKPVCEPYCYATMSIPRSSIVALTAGIGRK
jgi:hypothetical protein